MAKKLIEVAPFLPLDAISTASKADKDNKTGTIKNVHKWFAPMPTPALRALIFAAVVDAPESDEETVELLRLVEELVPPDENPVPVLISRTLTALLPAVAGRPPLQLVEGQLPVSSHPLDGLLEDVRRYATRIREDVWGRIGDLYRPEREGDRVVAWLWEMSFSLARLKCLSISLMPWRWSRIGYRRMVATQSTAEQSHRSWDWPWGNSPQPTRLNLAGISIHEMAHLRP